MLTSYILDLKDLLNMYSCEEQRFISGSNEKKKKKSKKLLKVFEYDESIICVYGRHAKFIFHVIFRLP